MADTGASLEFQLKKLDNQIAAQKGYVDRLKKTLADKNTDKRVRDYRSALLKMQEAKLGALNTKRGAVQNDYYKATGQYEKLLEGTNRDAFAAISALFNSYGLESLAGKVYEYVKNGYSADTVSILLQDTKEYKERFAGNELRKKQGLPVLSAGEYLATEASYRQIMQSAGLPSGFYDQHSDFNNWIGGNVSPSEIQTRVDLATQATVLANPDYKKALNQMGIQDGELTAYFLDQSKALPYIQKAAATAAIGAQALHNNLAFDQAYAESLATQGITSEQASQGYSQIAQESETIGNLASIYGTTYGQREAEKATFEGNAGATNKRKRLASQERGAFSGAAGTGAAGLSGRGGAK
jgi:hypothetical protein